MKRKYQFLLFTIIMLFSNCNVLSKSQIKNISVFATSAKSYTDFPSEIIKKRSVIVMTENLIEAIQFPADQIKTQVTAAQKRYRDQQLYADTLDLSLKLIQQYSSLLSKLSSESFVEDLNKNANELTDNLDNLVEIANSKLPNKVPAGVSEAIKKAIILVGERLTRSKQSKALKEFIPKGDVLIKVTLKNLVEALETSLPELLKNDKEKFINTYTNNVLVKPDKVNYISIKQYSDVLNDHDSLEQLRSKCIEAANKLLIAHERLTASILAKTDYKEIFKETQDLIVSIQGLYKIISQLSSNKQS